MFICLSDMYTYISSSLDTYEYLAWFPKHYSDKLSPTFIIEFRLHLSRELSPFSPRIDTTICSEFGHFCMGVAALAARPSSKN